MKIKYHILFAFVLLCLNTMAQQGKSNLDIFQDSLIKISMATVVAETDAKKADLNGRFVKNLVEALKTPNSFAYPFDSLKNVSLIKSPDKAFRILSWYVQQENGTYRYFGTIQMNTGNGPLKLYPLIDQTDNITDANVITNNQKWFGARYYDIVPVTSGNRSPYYILLGWKGNTLNTTKKVIEILSFDRELVNFGLPVFDGKELKNKNRIIFEYTKSNAMTLRVDQKAGMIVYDHLAPFDPEMVGKYEFYGSDGTFDGFKIIGGRLRLQEGLELNNDPSATDEQYADPKKNVKPIRKF